MSVSQLMRQLISLCTGEGGGEADRGEGRRSCGSCHSACFVHELKSRKIKSCKRNAGRGESSEECERGRTVASLLK